MRIYDIALFLFIFNLTLGMTNSFDLFGGTNVEPITEQGGETAEEKIHNIKDKTTQTGENPWGELGALGDAINFFAESVRLTLIGIPKFVEALYFTVNMGAILIDIGINAAFAGIITLIVDFVYITGLVQFITGRNIKRYQ